MRRLVVIAFLGMIASTGCAVRELRSDQDRIRSALLDLYTNQIMDNLIRASNGLPIIQLDYTNATATVTIKESIGGSQNVATTNNRAFTLPGQALAITRNIVNTANGSLSGDHTNQVALTATPVLNSNEVYDAYLGFLTLPGSLQVSCNKPDDCDVHIWRKWGDKYYWVPTEFKRDFLRLSLLTTAQRGKPLLPPDEFYEVSIVQVIEEKEPNPFKLIETHVRLNKKVPNDNGTIDLTLSGATVTFEVGDYNPPEPINKPPETDRIRIFFNPNKKGVPANMASLTELKLPVNARLKLKGWRPTQSPSTEQLLDRLQFQLQQIQFNQMR